MDATEIRSLLAVFREGFVEAQTIQECFARVCSSVNAVHISNVQRIRNPTTSEKIAVTANGGGFHIDLGSAIDIDSGGCSALCSALLFVRRGLPGK